MKKCFFIVGILVCYLFSCAPAYRVYDVERYADYDTLKNVFIDKEKYASDARFIIGAEEYIYYSDSCKMYVKRLSPALRYDDAYYSYVMYDGKRCRMIKYADDGYYGENRMTYMIYDIKKSRPLVNFSLGDTLSWNKVKRNDIEKIISDSAIVSSMGKKKNRRNDTLRAERQYLLHRGYDY